MRSRTRILAVLITAAVTLAIGTLPAVAQAPAKVARLGYLTSDSASVDLPRRNALKQGLRDLGYVEGQNLLVEYRAAGDFSKLPGLMAELIRLKVDVVFAFTTPAVLAAKKATSDLPVVFGAHAPVELGVVASLARPGGNLTGLTLTAGPSVYGKYTELLNEVTPGLNRFAVLSNPANPATDVQLREMKLVASALHVTLLPFEVKDLGELDTIFAAMKKARADALIVLADAGFLSQRGRIAELAIKSRLPSIFGIHEHVDAGGLMGYAANRLDIFRRAATYIDKILKGAKPADLPIEQPTAFELVINLKTAKALGLTIPPTLLLRANRVIE